MILAENIADLRKIRPDLVPALKTIDKELESSRIKLLDTRSGVSTLAMDNDGVLSYIHSKYDPVSEAQGIVAKLDADEVATYDHVFFYGVGLGYLVDAFMERFPDKYFTLYEPSSQILCHHLSYRLLNRLPLRKLRFLLVDIEEPDRLSNANCFFNAMYDKVLFITLPSYERLFSKEFEEFSEHFVFSIKVQMCNRSTSYVFQKRWTINSMVNFGENLHNNNIFDFQDTVFQNRPAILAAAGPSLAPELDNLRKIKEAGSAYIFSVGSSNRLLVNNNIYPHIWASIEPQGQNLLIFPEILEQKIDTIPLLYGTSIGHETVARYPGPKLFMMMDKDNVTPYFLPVSAKSTVKMVGDAPTVAITTLHALLLLGCNPIILVGQNLAFLNNRYYAEGIYYAGDTTNDLNNFKQEMVENVDGEQVTTQAAWNFSRIIMENMIKSAPGATVINATKQGAKIDGAPFKPLDEIMAEHLKSRVVDEEWYKSKQRHFDPNYLRKREERMSKANTQLVQRLENAQRIMERLKEIAPYNRSKQIEQEITQFLKCFDEIASNDYFKVFVYPMLMIENGFFQNGLAKLNVEKVSAERAKLLLMTFGSYLAKVKSNIKLHADPHYKMIKDAIDEYLKQIDAEKSIPSNNADIPCGTVHD